MRLKRQITMVITLVFFLSAAVIPAAAAETAGVPAFSQELPAKSYILIEASTGQVLAEQHADQQMPPASITKIMIMLLLMERIDAGEISLDDMVTTSEHANSMGGTQIWLEVGEQMSVNDLLKATAINSANDAAVALACKDGLAAFDAVGSLCPTQKGWLLGNELFGIMWDMAGD